MQEESVLDANFVPTEQLPLYIEHPRIEELQHEIGYAAQGRKEYGVFCIGSLVLLGSLACAELNAGLEAAMKPNIAPNDIAYSVLLSLNAGLVATTGVRFAAFCNRERRRIKNRHARLNTELHEIQNN